MRKEYLIKKMINTENASECCGCGGCAYVCPNGAISMVDDSEGFRYPQVDELKCINCGICNENCPIQNFEESKKIPLKAYIVQHKDTSIRKESTSGGAFSAIGEHIISGGG